MIKLLLTLLLVPKNVILFNKNKNLVYYHSKYYIKKHKLDYHKINDLYQEGFLGLFTACNKYNNTYDNKYNIKFSTYSSYWIRAHMTKYIKNYYKNNHISLNLDIYNKNYYNQLYDKKVYLDILDNDELDIIKLIYYHKKSKMYVKDKYNYTRYQLDKRLNIIYEKLKYTNDYS